MTMTKTRSLTLLLGAVLLASCGESALQVIAAPEPAGARVRFFNFGVNAPGVHFYANDTKMAAISSTGALNSSKGVSIGGTESVSGTGYGSVSSGGYYGAIAPGSYKLAGKIAAVTDNGLVISSVTQSLDAGKRYSYYVSGFYNTTTKSADGFVVEDPYSDTFDWNNATVRFVNAISNSQPMVLYAKNQTTGVEVPLGAAVAYKGAGTFTAIPGAVYDISARLAGSTANAFPTRTSVSFSAGYVYTITARGDITVTSTTATNRPFLDNTANR